MTRPSWGDFATHDESAYPELWDGVVGAWAPCLGPTGLRLHDHSRRNNWGTLTNATVLTAWTVSRGQYALTLDGVNDVIDCGDVLNNVFVGTESRFSVFAWINVTTSQNQFVASKIETSPTANRQWFLRANDDGLDFVWYGDLNALTFRVMRHARTFTTSGWVHVGADFDATVASADAKARLYVDGVQVATTIPFTAGSPVSIQTGTARLAIGGAVTSTGTASAVFAGSVDDIIIYNRLLAANEIRQLYLLGRGGMYQRRRRTLRRVGVEQGAAFKAYWARRNSQIIGGGV